MSLFSQEIFIRELRALVGTQEKIKTLALYMKTMATDSTKMVRILDKEFNSSNTSHKLNILYLANELIQSTKKEEKDLQLLLEQMKSFVVSNFEIVMKEVANYPVLKGKLLELKSLWIERSIFSESELSGTVTLNKYSREEVIRKIEEYFDSRDALADYLDGMVKRLRNN